MSGQQPFFCTPHMRTVADIGQNLRVGRIPRQGTPGVIPSGWLAGIVKQHIIPDHVRVPGSYLRGEGTPNGRLRERAGRLDMVGAAGGGHCDGCHLQVDVTPP
jgi:hypothetical protein